MVFMMNNPNESRMKFRPLLNLALLLLAVSPISNAAEKTASWSLSKNFSSEKNPNGPWFYGFSAYGGKTLTPIPAAKDILAVPGLDGWAVEAGTFPFVAKNTTAAPVGASGFSVLAGEVVVAPGVGTSDVINVRWTAPQDGIYGVNASWRRVNPQASALAFVIREQGLPSQEILFPGQPVPPTGEIIYQENTLELGAGDTLDFPVWAGHDGPDHDLVALKIDITYLAPAAEPRLLLDFPLEGNANDKSGRDHAVTVHGKPQPATSSDRKAMRFSGAGDWIDTGTNLSGLKKEFTIEAWVKPDAEQLANANIFGNHTDQGQGLVMQMDGSNMNRWAFATGIGGGPWAFTKPIQLTPDVWQHVAIVKSRRELQYFLNGVLLDTVDAPSSYVPSPMNFAIGLGFKDPARCFRGELAGVRVWDRALPEIKPDVSAAQRFQAMISNARVRLETAGTSRIFPAGKTPVIDVIFDDVVKMPEDSEIMAGFELTDYAGKPISIDPVKLAPANQFRAKLELPLPAGFYRLISKPTATGPSGRVDLPPVSLAFSVLGDSGAEAPPASRPAESPIDSTPTNITTLDGDDWLIATDPQNVGREQGWFNTPQPGAKKTKVPWIIQDIFNNYHGVAWYWHDFEAPLHADKDGRYILRFLGVDYLAEVWLNG